MNIMKRIILYLMFLALSLSVSAQQSVKFMGIPITDTYEQFVEKLSEKMNVTEQSLGHHTTFNDEFAGIRDCEITVYKKGKYIDRIFVIPSEFVIMDNKTAENVLTLYKQKYGSPQVEDFDGYLGKWHYSGTTYDFQIGNSNISLTIKNSTLGKKGMGLSIIYYPISKHKKQSIEDI